MSEENYLELLSIFDYVLKKQDTVLRQSISQLLVDSTVIENK